MHCASYVANSDRSRLARFRFSLSAPLRHSCKGIFHVSTDSGFQLWRLK
jgi:hypothetical protein